MSVEANKLEPPCIQFVDYLPRGSIAIPALADSEIRIDRRCQCLDILSSYASIELPHTRYRPTDDTSVRIDTIHLDMYTQTFEAFGVVLAVEFVWVHCRAQFRQPSAKFWKQQKNSFALADDIEVVYISSASHANAFEPQINAVEVIVHGILPYELAD